MSNLQYTLIQNFKQQNIQAGSTTSLQEDGDSTIPNTNTIPRVAWIKITPAPTNPSAPDDCVMGSWVVGSNMLTISGGQGGTMPYNMIWKTSTGLTAAQNPLRDTEFDPVNGLYPEGTLPNGETYVIPVEGDGQNGGMDWTTFPRVIKSVPSTMAWSDQNEENPYIYTNIDSPFTPMGGWISGEDIIPQIQNYFDTNTIPNANSSRWYTGPPQVVSAGEDFVSLWPSVVDKVALFNSLPLIAVNDDWAAANNAPSGLLRPQVGNVVYAMVKLKNDLIMTNTGMLENPAYVSGLNLGYLNYGEDDEEILTMTDDAQGNSELTIEIDLDGNAYFFCSETVPEGGIVNDEIIIDGDGESIDDDTTEIDIFIDHDDPPGKPNPTKPDQIKIPVRTRVDKTGAVANITLTAPDGQYYTKKPYLQTKHSNVRLKLKEVKKELTDNKGNFLPTFYSFDIIYKYKPRNMMVPLLVTLKNITTSTPTTLAPAIHGISCGGGIIDNRGEIRDIKIFGDPGANFGIAINEVYEETVEGEPYFDKVNDVSLLTNSNDTTTYGYGKDMPILTGTIDSTGIYSFKQRFPKSVFYKTQISGATTSATINFKDEVYEKVREGDRIYTKGISNTSVVKVDTLYSASKARLLLDTSITVADKDRVEFERKRCFTVELLEHYTDNVFIKENSKGSVKKLNQYSNPTLTIKNSTANSNLRITHNNGVATELDDAEDYEVNYLGRVNYNGRRFAGNKITTEATFSLLLDIQDSKNFTAIDFPKFSNIDQSKSHWTNSVPSQNGGTKVRIYNVSHTTTGENTITLTYKLLIERWGTEDTVIELDLDDIVTIA